MKFTWKPIKNINNLPRGVEIMVCIPKTKEFKGYCEYIRRGDGGIEEEDINGWYYVYTDRQIQDHKVKKFSHYFIPRTFNMDER